MLDDIIHSQPRLLIIILLFRVEECNFSFLKEKLEFTDGVLSVHLKKLEENKYISVKKSFLNNRPNTDYKITQKGRIKLLEYIANMEDLIKTVKDSL